MFSPLDFPEPLEEPRRRKEGFLSSSSTFLRLWATVGRYWAYLSSESPHPRMGPSSAHYLSNAHIPVPLLTVVSQSGEQTPPPAHAGFPSALCLKTVRPTCAKQESACRGTQRHLQTMSLCEEAVTYGAAVAFSQLGRILICPRGRSCQQPMSCSCASLVPIVCPASPHMRKGMACVIRHHDVKKWVSSWLDITSGVSNRTNRFRPHLPAWGSVGEESVLRTLTGSPATSQHHEPASLPSAGIHNHTFAAERVHDV